MNSEVKPEEQVLFPEVDINGIIVKPWSFGTLFRISEFLEEVIDKMEAKNINIESDFIPYTTIARIFTLASTPLLKIVALTLKMEEEKVMELDMETGIKIVIIMYKQNLSTIKNALTHLIPKKEEKTKKEKQVGEEQQ